MLGIVFQNLPRGNGFKNLVEWNVLLDHFLLGVLSHANVLRIGLSPYPLQPSLQPGNTYIVRTVVFHNHRHPNGLWASNLASQLADSCSSLTGGPRRRRTCFRYDYEAWVVMSPGRGVVWNGSPAGADLPAPASGSCGIVPGYTLILVTALLVLFGQTRLRLL